MRERGPTLRHAVDERPPPLIAASLSLQNALVVFGAIFLPIFMRSQGLITDGEAAFLVAPTLLTAGLSAAVEALRVGPIGAGYMLAMGTRTPASRRRSMPSNWRALAS